MSGHDVIADIDYVGAFLFSTTAPGDLVPGPELDAPNEAPPDAANYRDAEVGGVACWNCAHFTVGGPAENDGEAPEGVCNLWEAEVEGENVCDRFTAHADLLRQSPHTSWAEDVQQMRHDQIGMGEMAYSLGPSKVVAEFGERSVLNEIGFAGGAAVEEDGLIWKDILRTGHWSHTPTNQGLVEKSLDIIEDGESDPENGVLSLSEIVRNFDDGAVPYVTIPLSDDKTDHKNIARLNTGFVRKLKLVKNGAVTLLRAGCDFTEPDVKEKVLRGTLPDVSAGVPFGVTRRRDNKTFKAVLDHVCLTRKPFIDGLRPFGLMAADDDANLPVESFDEVEEETGEPSTESNDSTEAGAPVLSAREIESAVGVALFRQLGLAQDYRVVDIRGNDAIIEHSISNLRWNCAFTLTGTEAIPVQLAGVREWKLIEETTEQIAASEPPRPLSILEELTQAHQLRESRLAQPPNDDTTGGIQMSVTDLSLDGVELSDEARTRIQGVLDENKRLKRLDRGAAADKRVAELEGLGLKERPGALKLYRQVFLSDDGNPAAVLFADDGETPKEKVTSIEILDRFIEAMKADGGVVFSDQALASGNDEKPANTAEGEVDDLEKRVADSKEALYGKRTRRK